MGQRLDLHEIFKTLLGSNNVYFQPPATIKMLYPCIRYERDKIQSIFANDKPYGIDIRYQLIVIDQNPDSLIPMKVAKLPKCLHQRFYIADQLNHDVFNIFF